MSMTMEKPYRLNEVTTSDQVELLWGIDPMLRVRILRQNNGRLTCRHCSAEWCQHIQALITEGDDARLMFAENAEPHGSGIQIPMAPTFDLYAEIRTGAAHAAGGWAAHLIDKNRPLKAGLLDLQFMGFFDPRNGEGRAVLRLMIRDWITANWTVKPNCKVTAHNFDSERTMQANLSTDMHFPEWFCLWSEGMCLKCRQEMNDFSDPGLVPF